MLLILHSYWFQSNDELFKFPVLTSKNFCVFPCAPFATGIGRKLRSTALHCATLVHPVGARGFRTLFSPRCQTAVFFRYAQKRSLRYATFTKQAYAQPAPPSHFGHTINNKQKPPQPQLRRKPQRVTSSWGTPPNPRNTEGGKVAGFFSRNFSQSLTFSLRLAFS